MFHKFTTLDVLVDVEHTTCAHPILEFHYFKISPPYCIPKFSATDSTVSKTRPAHIILLILSFGLAYPNSIGGHIYLKGTTLPQNRRSYEPQIGHQLPLTSLMLLVICRSDGFAVPSNKFKARVRHALVKTANFTLALASSCSSMASTACGLNNLQASVTK